MSLSKAEFFKLIKELPKVELHNHLEGGAMYPDLALKLAARNKMDLPFKDEVTAAEVVSERAMLAVLDGSCRTPIAGLAIADEGQIHLRALVARPDGSEVLRTERNGAVCDAVELGHDAGQELKQAAGPEFLL